MVTARLTEEEVHAACAEIAAQGERPTAIKLLENLGRGSLTTITKYLNSWNATDEAQAIKAEELPALVKLPETLSKEGEDLLKKMWHTAKGLADEELDIQREALKQAELANQAKVEEAFKFSEAQAMKIERLEEVISELKTQLTQEHSDHAETIARLNEAEKSNVGLTKDNEQLQNEIRSLKNRTTKLEELNKTAARENQEQQQKYNHALKQKDTELRSLDMQVHKLQTSLDSVVKSNDQLKADIKGKTSELSDRIVELEKLSVRYESAVTDLNAAKADLKAAAKAASEAEKRVSKLEGQLEVYKLIKEASKK